MLASAMINLVSKLTRLVFGLGALGVMVTGCNRGEPYEGCGPGLPCGSDAPLCLSSTTATRRTVNFCSKRCTTPAANSTECPGSAACVRLNGGDPICMQRCTTTAECGFTGAACGGLAESMGQPVCTAAP